MLFLKDFFGIKKFQKKQKNDTEVYIIMYACNLSLTSCIITERGYIDMPRNTTRNIFGVL
jgi:hypothetical protein